MMSTCFVRFMSSNTLNYDSSTKWIYDNDNSRYNTLLIQDCSKWICQELNSESPALTLLICQGEAEDEAAAAWAPLAAATVEAPKPPPPLGSGGTDGSLKV